MIDVYTINASQLLLAQPYLLFSQINDEISVTRSERPVSEISNYYFIAIVHCKI